MNQLNPQMKPCSKCRQSLELTKFAPNKANKSGYGAQCKACVSAYSKAKNSKPEIKARNAEAERGRKERDPEAWAAQRAGVRERRKPKDAAWRESNKVHLQQAANERRRLRKLSDPVYKLSCNIRRLIQFAATTYVGGEKNSKTVEILGCNFEQLHVHLILTALENYGFWVETEDYEVDHIQPQSLAKTEAELIQLNHYTNLQLLTVADNRAKADRLDTEWQSRKLRA